MQNSILLVNPNNRILSPYAGIETPLWMGLIASDLRNKGKDVSILDAEAENLSVEATIKRIDCINPKEIIFVVMGNNPSVSSTPKMVATKRLIDILIGDYEISITGLHPSALPVETKNELGVPVLRGKIFDGTSDIAYDLMPMGEYEAHQWHCLNGKPRKPYASTYTSMGCNWNCAFCNVHALYNWQHKVYYRDIERFLAEIDKLVYEYNVLNIKLWDEHFTVNRERVMKICDGLIDRGYGLNMWAYARVDTVDPEMLDKMSKAGIAWLGVGYESGSDSVLDAIDKRAAKSEAVKATSMIHEAGISINGNFIFGLPGDNSITMQKTLDFAKSLELEWGNFYFAEMLPGSILYDKKDTNWTHYGQFNPLIKNQFDDFRDKAFKEFFTDPVYHDRIRKKFGQQAVDQVNAMLTFGKPKTRGIYEYSANNQKVVQESDSSENTEGKGN